MSGKRRILMLNYSRRSLGEFASVKIREMLLSPLRKNILFSLLLMIANLSFAQNFSWTKGTSGAGESEPSSVWADSSGQVLVTGRFNNTSVFDTISLTSAGNDDVFIAKYNAAGHVVWAQGQGCPNPDGGNFVCGDAAGNAIVTGVDGSTGVPFVFISKYDLHGNLLWRKIAGGNPGAVGSSVCTDPSGNIYITGYFACSPLVFDTVSINNHGITNAFLFKFDGNGNAIWGKCIGGSNYDYGYAVIADHSGNIFLTGDFGSPSLTLGTFVLNNAGQNDIFLVKYSPSGNVLWAKGVGGSIMVSVVRTGFQSKIVVMM